MKRRQRSANDASVRIRPVDLGEGERLREIAIAAKCYWGYDRELVARWADTGDFSPRGLQEKEIHVAESEGRVVGWASLIPKGEVALLDDLWIEPNWIRKGDRLAPLWSRSRAGQADGRDAPRVGGRTQRSRILRSDGRSIPPRQ